MVSLPLARTPQVGTELLFVAHPVDPFGRANIKPRIRVPAQVNVATANPHEFSVERGQSASLETQEAKASSTTVVP